MKIHFTLPAAVLAVIALPAWAELDLDAESAAACAQTQNLEMIAARGLIAEAEARTLTSGRLRNPELETELAGGQDFEGRIAVGIMQRFPMTGRLRLERERSDLDLEMARLEVKNRERQIALAARLAFYELASARASLVLARRQAKLADTFAESLRRSIADGFGSDLEAQQAKLVAESQQVNEASLRSREIAATARLNDLLGRPSNTPISIRESLALPKTVPASRPVGVRADLQLAELAWQAGATDVSLAEANRWDDIGIGIFIEGERFADEPEGIEPEALIGVRFSVPLPIWQNGSGDVAEKEAAHTRKAQQLDAMRFKLRNEALAAHQIMANRHQAAMQFDATLVPAATKQVSATEAAYQRGEVDIQSVFLARERLAAIEAAALNARTHYFQSYAEWIGALGESAPNP